MRAPKQSEFHARDRVVVRARRPRRWLLMAGYVALVGMALVFIVVILFGGNGR